MDTNYIDTIQAAHHSTEFIFKTSLTKMSIRISPELIAQLLDKLINNAISFHKKGTPIQLSLFKKKPFLIIELNNYGQLIETTKLDSIFSSLTSYRTQKEHEIHLGIGLYIARLISQFHNGKIEAINNEHNQSVSFILTVPINH
ncbi:MAG: GHKL domain-containing protein [gamma proteobacterium symbiont of Bathyaustriella thionipta]|nr:GHKL domain-containing protein [gamma proteobacterium symbiont of Bathyaustriella thionipta]MCU7949625.1 GHKL domain-containing protein [gamma proteobacterium symbiont of Bathyaustriella thionipta]MCU7952191.1 GHKL domain-containing protein [gamma proteobacterium symbiont of Bathyaustriella thionipta]MCU7956204.1 GHKL domain-containing protein [gamma proteobacterium symbiont of Bathyaustriella thionipta]MCU7966796.1 GHKL domain-containing protein [gamma proteobacterium symbiont of Bathyaustr